MRVSPLPRIAKATRHQGFVFLEDYGFGSHLASHTPPILAL